jgi:hypothetical protein
VIRTSNELIDRIADDLVWRRKELTDLRSLVQETHGQVRSRVLVRSAIALLYAHWEGFVKRASSNYLEFVASQRLPYKRLAPNFVGLTLRARFNELASSNKMSAANSIADFFCTAMDRQSNVPFKNIIDTRSNLSSKVLLDILSAIGVSSSPFETRLQFIDSNLVNPRNYIAHGEGVFFTVSEYIAMHDDVVTLLETFRNEIENASVLRNFERV